MEYTSIHIYGHLLSDNILHEIETDTTMQGNRDRDFGFETPVNRQIDYAWGSLRNDWRIFSERSLLKDAYGTRSVRKLMERMLSSLDYQLDYQSSFVVKNERSFDISYICHELDDMPVIIVGDKTGEAEIDTFGKCSLDYRTKGGNRRKSPHATMLDYLNNTDHVYGIVTNGLTLRLIRNTGQLVKLTYIEFDLRRMIEEDHYSEFCLLFRLLHASRFQQQGENPCPFEQWFNRSVESGNRIRAGLSNAVQKAMEILGTAVVCGMGEGNEQFRRDFSEGSITAATLNKELIHFIYRALFLFIIEDRNLVYQLPDVAHPDYARLVRCQDIYKKYYAASRLRSLSELMYLRNANYNDLWQGLMDTFRLFEDEKFGSSLAVKPLGGVLFGADTLHYLKKCSISNDRLLEAFGKLNEFQAEGGQWVKINYSSLDVEEFGSVYEGILEMRAVVIPHAEPALWQFTFGAGLDRKSSSSYYTRPDLVQSLIRTTLIPVIEERLKAKATAEEKVKDLLSMRVCDAACGSGHIVLAMARTIAWYVCQIRTGEDNPASLDYREALREVIQKCIYAVDYNPDAVELCKVVLWIEGYCAGKPLSFLDHHVRCGNSVVGVADLDTLLDGVPQKAFAAEDKDLLRQIRKLNGKALNDVAGVRDVNKQGLSVSLFNKDFPIQSIDKEQVGLAGKVLEIAALPEESLLQELTKQKRWEDLMQSPRVECLRRACDIYTYSFYKQFQAADLDSEVDDTGNFTSFDIPYTRTVYQALQEIKYLDDTDDMPDHQHLPKTFREEVAQVAANYRFFHWCVEFPEVFVDGGGFDVMCGNPPWDKIKVEDKKWFEKNGRSDIVKAGTAAQRKRAIANLSATDPQLYSKYIYDLANSEAISRFVRFSGRFNLTAIGDIDLYPLFAELCFSFAKEAWGLVLATGIAVNDSNKTFFSKLIDENRLISLYDFENREKLFDIDSRLKFCLLTAGNARTEARVVSGGFYLTRLDHLLDQNRIYNLCTDDFILLNPNTKTCPIFRTSRDAQLTSKIYHNTKVLMNEATGENPWRVKFGRMFDMSNDSHLFRTYVQLTEEGAKLEGNKFTLNGVSYVPIYEGKMIWFYNHHFGTWPTEGERPSTVASVAVDELSNPSSCIMPWYWVAQSAVDNRLVKYDNEGNVVWEWKHKWLMGYRCIARSVDIRTFVISLIPSVSGVGHSSTLLYPERGTMSGAILLGMMSSLPFDFAVRQKVGGINLSAFFVKQFPVLTPEQIPDWAKMEIVKRVVELCYFNHDLDSWVRELWDEMTNRERAVLLLHLAKCNELCLDEDKYSIPEFSNLVPFRYDENHRARSQAELDAIFAHLYGLSTEDLRYILDPEDVYGKGCINETFRVLKDNEMRQYGEYRTKRLVMEAWQNFGFGK